MAAITFLLIALIGVSTLFIASKRSAEVAHERAIITHYFRYLSEKIRGGAFRDIVDNYQDYTFRIDELDVDGSVKVFVDETASTAEALEMGLPRDLDGDGAATNADVSSGYILLPVQITATRAYDPSFTLVRRFFLSQEE